MISLLMYELSSDYMYYQKSLQKQLIHIVVRFIQISKNNFNFSIQHIYLKMLLYMKPVFQMDKT